MKTKKTTKKQDDLIEKIAKRAALLADFDKLTTIMDLTACIEGGCPLRLEGLLNASRPDFMHDISGINQNLNHETHKLDHCFLPRFKGFEKSGNKAKAKNKFVYTVTVDCLGTYEVFYGIKANSAKEANDKASEKFMKRYFNKKNCKAHVEQKDFNL